jgi:hypothetical protein
MAEAAKDVRSSLKRFRASGGSRVRNEALEKLRAMGSAAVDIIINELTTGGPQQRECAAKCLGELQCSDERAIEALVDTLQYSGARAQEVRGTAGYALHKIGAPAIPSLLKVVREAHGDARDRAIGALGRACRDDEILDVVVSALEGSSRGAAIGAIDTMGGRCIPAIPRMLSAGAWNDSETNSLIYGVIGDIATLGFKRILRTLVDGEAEVKERAVRTLDYLGVLLDWSSGILAQEAEAGVESVKKSAVSVLGTLVTSAADALGRSLRVIERLQKAEEDAIRREAIVVREAIALRLPGLFRDQRIVVDLATKDADRRKRVAAELTKCLLALAETCLEWPREPISERRLQASQSLMMHRKKYGLVGEISVASIHNHLKVLARLCSVKSIFATEAKRQRSFLNEGIRARLRTQREDLIERLREEERRVAQIIELQKRMKAIDR